jgi:hypothetical protein
VSYRNDYEQEYGRGRWFYRASTEEEGQGKGKPAAKQDYQQRL